ncbi:MAG: hypothetical protein RL757_1154 [Bacteroidota bacterium]|jgi:phosphohistidine phosphatase
MKNLFIVRHAKSDWSHAGLRDHDRPLSERGFHDAPLMAELLKNVLTNELQTLPAEVQLMSSSATRARTTAAFFATAFGQSAEKLHIESDIYEADLSDIFYVIGQLDAAKNTAFLFGHNPTLTYFVSQFAEKVIVNMPTCGVSLLQSTAENWSDVNRKNTTMENYWFPKLVLSAYQS